MLDHLNICLNRFHMAIKMSVEANWLCQEEIYKATKNASNLTFRVLTFQQAINSWMVPPPSNKIRTSLPFVSKTLYIIILLDTARKDLPPYTYLQHICGIFLILLWSNSAMHSTFSL